MEDEPGEACSTHGRNEKCRKPEEKYHLEDLSLDGRIILRGILEKWG